MQCRSLKETRSVANSLIYILFIYLTNYLSICMFLHFRYGRTCEACTVYWIIERLHKWLHDVEFRVVLLRKLIMKKLTKQGHCLPFLFQVGFKAALSNLELFRLCHWTPPLFCTRHADPFMTSCVRAWVKSRKMLSLYPFRHRYVYMYTIYSVFHLSAFKIWSRFIFFFLTSAIKKLSKKDPVFL